MSAFRATSRPERSSRGCGSVYPRSRAVRTASESGVPAIASWQRNPSVPERLPSMRSTTSPVATRFFSVSMTGRPAPTVVS